MTEWTDRPLWSGFAHHRLTNSGSDATMKTVIQGFRGPIRSSAAPRNGTVIAPILARSLAERLARAGHGTHFHGYGSALAPRLTSNVRQDARRYGFQRGLQ